MGASPALRAGATVAPGSPSVGAYGTACSPLRLVGAGVVVPAGGAENRLRLWSEIRRVATRGPIAERKGGNRAPTGIC